VAVAVAVGSYRFAAVVAVALVGVVTIGVRKNFKKQGQCDSFLGEGKVGVSTRLISANDPSLPLHGQLHPSRWEGISTKS